MVGNLKDRISICVLTLKRKEVVFFYESNTRSHTSLMIRKNLKELDSLEPQTPELAPSSYHLLRSLRSCVNNLKLISTGCRSKMPKVLLYESFFFDLLFSYYSTRFDYFQNLICKGLVPFQCFNNNLCVVIPKFVMLLTFGNCFAAWVTQLNFTNGILNTTHFYPTHRLLGL